jgi:hypothetical protein
MTATVDPIFRVYEPDECGGDGYPLAWHRLPDDLLLDWSSSAGEHHVPPGARMGIKHLARIEAGQRCERCGHPYAPARGRPRQWTPCDRRCTHGGPIRVAVGRGPWSVNRDQKVKTGLIFSAGDGIEVEAEWRILTTHHLTGSWGSTSEAKRDCRWWNLAALCQRCHLVIQGKVQMERAFIFEHTDWFKPHAAGWYAWKYLGEDLPRADAMGRLDELLGLERLL